MAGSEHELKKKPKLTEEMVTEVTLSELEKNPEGITKYPILEFDERALRLLSAGVAETLQYSHVKPAGGRAYCAVKRLIAQDGGNPIFSQERLTENGKMFRMYKFRSMCQDAEEKFAEVQKENQTDGLAFKSDSDPRITRFGHFIRKTSIDELPQLWNVLRGQMSIIGPRPPLPREVVLYTPHQMERLLVKGGLSCICQVEGRSDMGFDAWVESDIRYIQTRNLRMDIKLMFKMLVAVFRRKGAR